MSIEFYVCRGSRCNKHETEVKDLRRALAKHASVKRVKCQKICKGPVVGVRLNGELHWFRKCRSKLDRADLVCLARGGRPSQSLVDKRVDLRAKKSR